MNIDYANTIPLRLVFDKMGLQPSQKTEDFLYYLSPFREEIIPSIYVNVKVNHWYNAISKTGGNVIAFACFYLQQSDEPCTIMDALKWVETNVGYVVLQCPDNLPDYSEQNAQYHYKDHEHLSNPELIRYLEETRGIPFNYARFFLKEVTVIDSSTGKQRKAIGLKNEDGGFAIRSPYLKANIGPLNITFIRGKIPGHGSVNIFKDAFDYLSMLTIRQGKRFDGDTIILNSLSCMGMSAAYIRNYGYRTAYTWLDNDEIGQQATRNYAAFFRSELHLLHRPMNHIYAGHKDVNDWHVASNLKR